MAGRKDIKTSLSKKKKKKVNLKIFYGFKLNTLHLCARLSIWD